MHACLRENVRKMSHFVTKALEFQIFKNPLWLGLSRDDGRVSDWFAERSEAKRGYGELVLKM